MQDGAYQPTSSQANREEHPKASLRPDGVKPSNFIKIYRPDADIFGTFVIDREMMIPDKASGCNLNLQASDTGKLVVNAFILPSSLSTPEEDSKCATRIHASADTVSIGIYETSPEETRHPLYIQPFGTELWISLPRSFNGPVKLRQRGDQVVYSGGMKAEFTLFVEDGDLIEGFIGEFDPLQWKGFDEWKGDRLQTYGFELGSQLVLEYNNEA